MSGVAFQIIAPLPPQPLQRTVDPMRLLELRARVMAAIADIDRALVEMRSRSIERRSAAPAPPDDRPPPGAPIEYSGGGYVSDTTGAHHVVELTLPDVRHLFQDLIVLLGANQEQVTQWWQRLADGRDGRPRAKVATRAGGR
jgi:hypothetical protein